MRRAGRARPDLRFAGRSPPAVASHWRDRTSQRLSNIHTKLSIGSSKTVWESCTSGHIRAGMGRGAITCCLSIPAALAAHLVSHCACFLRSIPRYRRCGERVEG